MATNHFSITWKSTSSAPSADPCDTAFEASLLAAQDKQKELQAALTKAQAKEKELQTSLAEAQGREEEDLLGLAGLDVDALEAEEQLPAT